MDEEPEMEAGGGVMAASDSEPRAGDLVLLRHGQTGSRPGLHFLQEVLSDGLHGRFETVVAPSQVFTSPLTDVVWCGHTAHKLAGPLNLYPMPIAPVKAAAPPREPAATKVTIHVINRAFDVEIVRHWSDPSVTVHIDAGPVVGTNRSGQPIRSFEVDE